MKLLYPSWKYCYLSCLANRQHYNTFLQTYTSVFLHYIQLGKSLSHLFQTLITWFELFIQMMLSWCILSFWHKLTEYYVSCCVGKIYMIFLIWPFLGRTTNEFCFCFCVLFWINSFIWTLNDFLSDCISWHPVSFRMFSISFSLISHMFSALPQ